MARLDDADIADSESDTAENVRAGNVSGEDEEQGDAKINDKNKDKKEDDQGEPKVRKSRPRFSENHLVGANGLEKIYESFPTICRFHGAGHEATDLRRLLRCYKEWAYQLFPQLAFEDFLERLQTFGGKARIRNIMEELRSKERERYLSEKFGSNYEDQVDEYRKAKAREEARLEAERIRRREELYGLNQTKTKAAAESSETRVEDLGAEENLEEMMRERIERRKRIEKELEAKRKDKGGDKKEKKKKNKKQKKKSSSSSSSESGSSSSSGSDSDSSTASSSQGPKRKKVKLQGDEEGSERLFSFVESLVREHGSITDVDALLLSSKDDDLTMTQQAMETCQLQNHSAETVSQTMALMLRQIAAAHADAASARDDDVEVPSDLDLIVGREELVYYLESLLSEISIQETSLKVVLGHVADHFEISPEDMVSIRDSVKDILVDILNRPENSQEEKEEDDSDADACDEEESQHLSEMEEIARQIVSSPQVEDIMSLMMEEPFLSPSPNDEEERLIPPVEEGTQQEMPTQEAPLPPSIEDLESAEESETLPQQQAHPIATEEDSDEMMISSDDEDHFNNNDDETSSDFITNVSQDF